VIVKTGADDPHPQAEALTPAAMHELSAMIHGGRDEAVASYRRALALSPGFAEAHNNLGGALRGPGQLEDAVA
jgi:Tfp pilus assembly protein PilF